MKISVSKGLTVNLGNYNSAKFEYSVESDEIKMEGLEEEKKKLQEIVNNYVNIEFNKINKIKGKL